MLEQAGDGHCFDSLLSNRHRDLGVLIGNHRFWWLTSPFVALSVAGHDPWNFNPLFGRWERWVRRWTVRRGEGVERRSIQVKDYLSQEEIWCSLLRLSLYLFRRCCLLPCSFKRLFQIVFWPLQSASNEIWSGRRHASVLLLGYLDVLVIETTAEQLTIVWYASGGGREKGEAVDKKKVKREILFKLDTNSARRADGEETYVLCQGREQIVERAPMADRFPVWLN